MLFCWVLILVAEKWLLEKLIDEAFDVKKINKKKEGEKCLLLLHCLFIVFSSFLSAPLIKAPFFAKQGGTINKNLLSGWLNQG